MKTKYILINTLITMGLIPGGPLFAQDAVCSGLAGYFPLRDVFGGETFRISDFEGHPILMESFVGWCPTCTQQQQETRKLHKLNLLVRKTDR